MANGDSVCCRNTEGIVTFFSCADPALKKASFWENAYNHGTSAEQSFGTRSRNVTGLKLRLVIPSGATRVTVESLKKTMQSAIEGSTKLINTTATILDQATFEAGDKAIYNRLLSVSPFGDFQTWIREADYVSYMRGYGGYTPPDAKNIGTLTDAFEKLAPKAGNQTKSRDWDASRNEQAKKMGLTVRSDTT